MHAVIGVGGRVEARPLVDHGHRRTAGGRRLRPGRDPRVEVDDALGAARATAGVQGDDLRDEDLHVGVGGTHLPDELGVGGEDAVGGDAAPDVVRAEVHDNDVRLGRRQPSGQQVLVGGGGGLEAAVAFVVGVVREGAVLGVQCADEVDVGVTGVLQLVPQEGAPAAR